MAKVKILLEDGETQLDADQALQKALEFHSNGDAHDTESFEDPAMVHMSARMEEIGTRIVTEMIREIQDVLDKEYSHGGE